MIEHPCPFYIRAHSLLAQALNELLGVRVSKSTICRMVGRLGYTRKKDQWVLQKEMHGSEQLGG